MGLLGFAPPQGLPSGGSGSGGVTIQEDGGGLGSFTTINFSTGVTAVDSGGGVATVTATGAAFDPSTQSTFFDDFLGNVASGGASAVKFSSLPFLTALSAAPANALSQAGTADHPGIAQFTTGTSGTGFAGARADNSSILFAGGQCTYEALVNIPTLSAVAEEYDLYVGFSDAFTGTAPVDGAYFKYDRNTSTDWLRGTSQNSTPTETASGTAVGTGWTKLKVVVNAAGTSVEFFINGVSVGSNTTNIPTGTGRETGFGMIIIKSAGTTARTFSCDYVKVDLTLTTPR